MEKTIKKRGNPFSNSQRWDTTKEAISSKYSTLTKKIRENTNRTKFNSSDLYVPRGIKPKNLTQSPIVKAYNNFDEFYKSIRPRRLKTIPDSSSESVFSDKPEILISYYSKKSSINEEDCIEGLSSVITQDQLLLFSQKFNPENLAEETEE